MWFMQHAPNQCAPSAQSPDSAYLAAGDGTVEPEACSTPEPAADAVATGSPAQLGRGRRARKVTTKVAAAGVDSAAALGRAPAASGAAPRTKAPKRPRDECSDGKASPGGTAGASDTTAFPRQPTPPAAATASPTSTSTTARVKRARKGIPVRSSE